MTANLVEVFDDVDRLPDGVSAGEPLTEQLACFADNGVDLDGEEIEISDAVFDACFGDV